MRIKHTLKYIDNVINNSISRTLLLIKKTLYDLFSSFEKIKNLAETNYTLALQHIADGQYTDAHLRLKLAIYYQKDLYPKAYYYLARVTWLKKSEEKAKHYIKIAKELLPNDEEVIFLDKRLHTPETITYIPEGIIKENFNIVAPIYNRLYLEELEYKGHTETVKNLKLAIDGLTGHRVDILDLGCGTGLVGQKLAQYNITRFMDGVDISSTMLNQCSELRMNDNSLYTNLVNKGILPYLQTTPQIYHAIIASHTIHYFGDLTELLSLCHKCTHPQGFLAFNVATDPYLVKPYKIDNTLDIFFHHPDYVNEQLTNTGWKKSYQQQIEVTKGQLATIYIVQKT